MVGRASLRHSRAQRMTLALYLLCTALNCRLPAVQLCAKPNPHSAFGAACLLPVLAIKRTGACRQLHQQSGLDEVFGEYNPEERDPSASMLRIEGRRWDEAKLERGCQMMSEGIGLKVAARDVRSMSLVCLRSVFMCGLCRFACNPIWCYACDRHISGHWVEDACMRLYQPCAGMHCLRMQLCAAGRGAHG